MAGATPGIGDRVRYVTGPNGATIPGLHGKTGVIVDTSGPYRVITLDESGATAYAHRDFLALGPPRDRGRDTSPELTEARTVLSRAENAIRSLDAWQRHRDAGESWSRPADADHDDIRAALQTAVLALSPWRRTGRTRP